MNRGNGGDILATSREILNFLSGLGLTGAEVYLAEARALTVEVSEGRVETLKSSTERGVGIRLFHDHRLGFAYTTDLSREAVERTVRQAMANARSTEPDEYHRLAPPADTFPLVDIYDPGIEAAKVEEKLERALRLERAALDFSPLVKRVRKASYFDVVYGVALVNSLGWQASYRGSYCGSGILAVAEDGGESQAGGSSDINLRYADLKIEEVGREAAEKAVRMLGARPIPTRKAVLVLDPEVAAELLSVIGPALSAEAVQKGKSLFAGKLEQQVASPAVTLVDDGRLPGGVMTSPVDGEGVPTSRTVLIEKGRLRGYLHNLYTAAREGVSSTGNGRRTFRSTPQVGPSNLFIQSGHAGREELLRGVKEGFYVSEVMGVHTANPVSGDFSLGAAGLWIEGGEFTRAVRGVAVAANIIDLLGSVEEVASDLRFFGSYGSPTLRVSPLTISGT